MPEEFVQPSPTTENRQNKKPVGMILAIVCVVIILAIALLLLKKSGNSKKSLPTKDQTTFSQSPLTPGIGHPLPLPHIDTVTLTDKGFSPVAVTVQKGNAVKWINNTSSDDESVNSDDYPTNQRFPELNLGKFSKGSAMSHIFTKTGTYTYHNNFHPEQKGTIVVE